MYRTTVKVDFWDEDINILDAFINGNFENPPIVVLSAMRLKLYQGYICIQYDQNKCNCISLHFRTNNSYFNVLGRVQISGIRASRLFINIDYEAVARIRQRL